MPHQYQNVLTRISSNLENTLTVGKMIDQNHFPEYPETSAAGIAYIINCNGFDELVIRKLINEISYYIFTNNKLPIY